MKKHAALMRIQELSESGAIPKELALPSLVVTWFVWFFHLLNSNGITLGLFFFSGKEIVIEFQSMVTTKMLMLSSSINPWLSLTKNLKNILFTMFFLLFPLSFVMLLMEQVI